MINQVIILNTLADNAADVLVDANGQLQITGGKEVIMASAPAFRVRRQNAVAEILGVNVITFANAVSGLNYTLRVTGSTALLGGTTPVVKTFNVQATSVDTVTTIAEKFVVAINAENANLRITASKASGVLTLTAQAGFPDIYVVDPNGDTANITITAFGSGAAVAGVAAINYGTSLATNPNFTGAQTTGSFTSGAAYTSFRFTWRKVSTPEAPTANTDILANVFLFINNAATAAYLDLLINTSYGTLTLLQAGQRAIVAASTVTVATASTGVLTFGAATLTAKVGEYFVVSPTVNVLVLGLLNSTTGMAIPASVNTVATTYKVSPVPLPR